MRVKEYLEQLNENEQATFIVVEVVKEEHSPIAMQQYRSVPVRAVWEWKRSNEEFLNSLIVNKDYPPIDITGTWLNWYNQGHLKCCIIQSEESLHTMYSEKQAKDMIKFYEDNIK